MEKEIGKMSVEGKGLSYILMFILLLGFSD
jgi:hypothetical protein